MAKIIHCLMQFFSLLILFFTLFLKCGDVAKMDTMPKAIKGKLELGKWNFDSKRNLKLDGEWEFYWKELFTSEELSCVNSKLNCVNSDYGSRILETDFIEVPHSWNGHKNIYKQQEPIPDGDGYATYRLNILLPDKLLNEVMAIRSDFQGTAYRIYCNSVLIQSVGKVNKDKEIAEAMNLPSVGFFTITNNKLEIIVQVSNYHNRLGGFWNHIYLGKSDQIISLNNQYRGTDFLVVGVISIMGIYHFLIWMIRKKDTSPLYFSLLCFIVLIRLLSTSEYLIVEAFPQLGYKFHCLLEYGSIYFCVPVGIHYFSLNIRNRNNKIIINVTYLIAIGFLLFAIFTPVKIFSNSAEYYQYVLISGILYILYILIFSIVKKIEYSMLSLFGFIILAVTIVQDILYSREIIQTGFYGPYALIVMIFSQSMILSLKFSRAFHKVEELTESLEIKVKERTQELNRSKEDIEALNNFTNIINSYSDLKQVFIEISKYVFQKYNIAAVWLYLPDVKEQYLRIFKIYSHKKIPDNAYQFMENLHIPLTKEGGISYIVWRRKKNFFARNLSKYNFEIDKEIMNATGSVSMLEVPLLMGKKTIGLMAFSNIESAMHLDKEDIKKINIFCSQIAGVVNTVNLLFQTEKQKKEIEELNTLIKSLNEDLDIKVIMKKVHTYIKKYYNVQHFGLSSVTPNKKNLRIIDYTLPDFISEELKSRLLIFGSKGISIKGAHSIAFKTKKPIFSKVRKSILNKEELYIVQLIKAENVILIPLILQNEPIGFLDLYNVGKLSLSKTDITKLSILGEQLAGIINGSNLFTELQESKKIADNALERAEIDKKLAMLSQLEAEKERQKSEKLLLNILPQEIALELKEKGFTEPVLYDSVSVLFTDFTGFTQIAEKMTPTELIAELDGCFRQFDILTESYNMEKLKTIGDSYMCVGGVPQKNTTNSVDAVLVALEIQAFMIKLNKTRRKQNIPFWELRLGIHTGPLVAGVIGQKKFAYDVWGDTVNIASRMESSGSPNKINISGSTYELVKNFFDCEYRGKINAKNKGEVDMYYVLGIKESLYTNNEEIAVPNEKFWELYWSL